jgi:hypothetical protein
MAIDNAKATSKSYKLYYIHHCHHHKNYNFENIDFLLP